MVFAEIVLSIALSFLTALSLHLPGKEFLEATRSDRSFKLMITGRDKEILKTTLILTPIIFAVEVIGSLVYRLLTGSRI